MLPLEIIFYIFLVSSALLLLYHLTALIALGFYKYKYETHNLSVSVVVSAHFEYANLQKLIPTLLEQKHQHFEIVIVDDKSEDGSYEYLQEMSSKHDQLKFVRIDHTPDHISDKKYALTLGIKAAQNDIILLTDADCVPASDEWITKMTAPFADDKVNIVLGASVYQRESGLVNIITRIETLYTVLSYALFALLGNPYMGVGRNLGIRKSFFMEKKGYGKYQGLLGGDDDLFVNEHAKASNTRLVMKSSASTCSRSKKTWKDYVIQKKRHMSVGKFYRLKDRMILGAIILIKIIFWLTFFTVIVTDYSINEILIAFISVLVSLLGVLFVLKRKIGESTKLWLLPILDIIYLICYLSIGLKVKFTKKVKWS